MSSTSSHTHFFGELKSSLAGSSGEQRKQWAIAIISGNISITSLATVLSSGGKTSSHFLWLVSDVALQDSKRLLAELPELFDFMEKNYPEHLSAFASWWHYCGVPEENEAKAIDYLFKWFLSAETAVYIKTRALWVLAELSKKHPELKVELGICIGDQMSKYSKEFEKRAKKILATLEN